MSEATVSKQKIFAFIAAIVIIIIGGVILIIQKEKKEEEAPEEPIPIEELSGILPLEPIDWENPEKPMQSWPLEEIEIPEEAIKIGVTAEGFSPSSFEVKKGKEIVLAVTSQDRWVHIFKFKDSSLDRVAVGVMPDETRAITFYAPSEPGEYPFFCDVPGHEYHGEKGVMIVK